MIRQPGAAPGSPAHKTGALTVVLLAQIINVLILYMDIGTCKHCKKLRKLLFPCTSCSTKFCTSCIQLERHACSKMSERKDAERERIHTQNPLVIASKIQSF